MAAVRNEALTFDGSLYLPLAGGTMSGAIQVANDNTIDLGTASKRWKSVYAYTVELKSGVVGTGALSIDGNAGITIGGTNATGLVLGRAATTTQVNGTLRYDKTLGGAAAAGLATLPSNPIDFLVINVGGVNRNVPYYG